MNVYDSNNMISIMEPLGYEQSNNLETADLIILNTCHIREKASEKVFSELGRLKILKEEQKRSGKQILLAVAGCVAQAEGDSILKRSPHIDIILGPQTIHKLPELVARAHRNFSTQIEANFPVESKFDFLIPRIEGKFSAFLTIQEGCDKFCTFCVVPYTRGAEYSRPASKILNEAEIYAKSGVKEITLLGQNVNAYHGESPSDNKSWSLANLAYAIAKIDGIERIRYTTSHPRDVTKDLINAHKNIPELMPHIHLPVQSGSDRILKLMNRGYTSKDYLTIIDKLRNAKPDIALSSDFIVGYPSETKEDFNKTIKLIEEIQYAQSFSFKYSSRPGTPSSYNKNSVSDDVKSERLQELQSLLRKQQNEFNKKFVGESLKVLITEKRNKNEQITGRSPYLQSVNLKSSDKHIGKIMEVKINKVMNNSLAGHLS